MFISKKISCSSGYNQKTETLLSQKGIRTFIKMNTKKNHYESKYNNCSINNTLNRVSVDGLQIEFYRKTLKNNKTFALAAVKNNGFAFKFLSENLKEDKDIALAAVKNNGFAFKFLPKNLKEDKDIVNAAVNQNGLVLDLTSNKYRTDLNTLFIAMSNSHEALSFSAPSLKDGAKLTQFIENKRKRYSCTENKFKLILFGIKKDSFLHRLNIGKESIIVEKILKFTGVQMGKEWKGINSVANYLDALP